MEATVTTRSGNGPRVVPEKRPEMVKAVLRKPDKHVSSAQIGACLEAARHAAGWNLDQLAHALDKDPRQVQRWIDGKEHAQIVAVFNVPELQAPFVIALAALAPGCDIVTTISIRKRA
jgi:ribosome-binding protein aMBF1 (putative translation factor)